MYSFKEMVFKDRVVAAYQQIQDQICKSLELTDGKAKFEEEIWNREGGGGGMRWREGYLLKTDG